MKKLRSVMLLSTFLFALGAFAFQSGSGQDANQGHGQGQGQGQGRGMPSVDDHVKLLTEKLDLTADQQAKIKTILEDQRQQMDAIRKDDSLSREDKMSKARALREASQAKVREILNDDQKKKLDQLEQEMRDRSRQRQGGDSNPK
jgi:periplasmic protein CpxP/Spy